MRTHIFLPVKALLFLLAITTLWTTQVAMKPAPEDTGNTLSVTFPASGTAQLNWSFAPLMQATSYIVIIDLVERSTVSSFTSNQSTATVGGLKPGHLYQFKVQNGNNTILIEDWIP